MQAARFFKLTVSDDRLTAALEYQMPSADDWDPIADQELRAYLAEQKITSLDEDGVRAVIEAWNGGTACKAPLCVARGLAPTPGRDGGIAWNNEFFSTGGKGADHDHAKKDHYQRRLVVLATAGAELGTLQPPEAGTEGRDVYGQALPAALGEPAALRAGDGVSVSDDGRTFRAERDGRVVLVDETLHIREFFEVSGDVDFSTGNVTFGGAIHVHGNVLDLFSVKSDSLIEVEGFVEGAFLTCAGDVRVQGGIAGKSKGLVKAGGSVSAKYLGSAQVRAGKDLTVANNISASEAGAGGEVLIPEGAIRGGRVTAGRRIVAREAGTESGTRTLLAVGLDWRLEEEHEALQKELAEAEAQAEAWTAEVQAAKTRLPQLDAAARAQLRARLLAFKALRETMAVKQQRRKQLREQRAALPLKAEVLINGMVYPGVDVQIGEGVFYPVRHPLKGPLKFRFNRVDRSVTVLGLQGPAAAGR